MITFHILDSINCYVEGLTWPQKEYIIEKTKLSVAGAHMTAAFKTGNWDGKESLLDEDGTTFIYMLDQICEALDDIGVDVDDIVIEDHRKDLIAIPTFDEIPVDILKEETGFDLRDHQHQAIKVAMDNLCGVIAASTSSGKSLITVAISKLLDPYIKTLILVPSTMLVNQTYEYYAKTELKTIKLGEYKPNARAKAIEDNNHIICTYKMLQTSRELFVDGMYAILSDECQVFGDLTAEIFRDELSNCPVRIGLTGSMPPDKHKAQKIHAHLGGGELIKISVKDMTEKKIIATANIELIKTKHPDVDDLSDDPMWDWDNETNYYTTNVARLDAIARYINNLPRTNTLILCQPQAGEIMKTHFNGTMIRDETKIVDREEWLGAFETSTEPYYQCASFGTAGTGISVNQIQRVVLVDIGKPETLILQCIGRGVRLDGKTNQVDILDISASTKYALRHAKVRVKLYKREHIEYSINPNGIYVEDVD